MRIPVLGLLALLAMAPSARAQGLPGGIPGLSGVPGLGSAQETPEQKRAFCQRVAGAAARCGLTLDVTALTSCLVRSLPPQDSLRVAQTAERARGNAGALLGDCGISAR
jgi:hypothetical protein